MYRVLKGLTKEYEYSCASDHKEYLLNKVDPYFLDDTTVALLYNRKNKQFNERI